MNAAAKAVVSQETRGGLMAEVTGGTPLSRGSMVRAVRTKGASIAGIRLAVDELVRWPFPRPVRNRAPLGERTA